MPCFRREGEEDILLPGSILRPGISNGMDEGEWNALLQLGVCSAGYSPAAWTNHTTKEVLSARFVKRGPPLRSLSDCSQISPRSQAISGDRKRSPDQNSQWLPLPDQARPGTNLLEPLSAGVVPQCESQIWLYAFLPDVQRHCQTCMHNNPEHPLWVFLLFVSRRFGGSSGGNKLTFQD